VQLSHLLVFFICGGLLFMLLPGTFLGVWNLVSISGRRAAESISPAWIQAYGHAQVLGWIGSFISRDRVLLNSEIAWRSQAFRSLVSMADRHDVGGGRAVALAGECVSVAMAHVGLGVPLQSRRDVRLPRRDLMERVVLRYCFASP
jgi:hypothetical protein